MKSYLIILYFLCLSCLNACGPNEIKPVEKIQKEVPESIEKKEKILSTQEELEISKRLSIEFKSLHDQLNSFKKKGDFHVNGFSIASPYKDWWDKVGELNRDPNIKILVKKGSIPGELQNLGMEYLSSKGIETEYSNFINSELKRAK